MSATVKYNGSTIASVEDGASVELDTQGKYMSGNVTVEAAGGGGGIVTRAVTYTYNDANAMYYTDATMTPQAITSGDKDLNNIQLPVGSLVIYVRTSRAEPMPVPSVIGGLHILQSYPAGKGSVIIYEVIPET